jgi:peptidyl-tRNA hydrolase, PTH1 family
VKTVIGLGNPGRQYESTPHNIGFLVLGRLAERFSCALRKNARYQASVGRTALEDGSAVLLVQPLTFMNSSGDAVAAVLRYYQGDPQGMVVVVDDADLPMGRMRIRASGGSGGHRGLASVIESCGTDGFARLRIGIGRARESERGGLVDHVLSPFTAAERAWVDRIVAQATEAVIGILRDGAEAAMNRFNGMTIPEAEAEKAAGVQSVKRETGGNESGHRTGEQQN